MMELMVKTALTTPVDPQQIKKLSETNKQWHLVFLRSPTQFVAQKNSSRIGQIQFSVNRLEVRVCSRWLFVLFWVILKVVLHAAIAQ